MVDYPEVYIYGWVLPSSGLYFRHINNLKVDNVHINVLKDDDRDLMIFDDVI